MAEWMRRLLMVLAGVLGVTGVAFAAMASHGEDTRNLAAISTMALAHAPALLAIGLTGRGRAIAVAGLVLAFGVVMFIADLVVRQWFGHGLFPGAAPIGGAGMMLGWVGVALSAASRNFG